MDVLFFQFKLSFNYFSISYAVEKITAIIKQDITAN